MDENKVLLLVQLVNKLDENYSNLEKAYNNSNKINFENSKKAVFELQNKINFILTKNAV